jgi:hypothetical protein
MASKLNTEFNYRYQVIGETPWAKIETLKGFLVGRKRAAVLEEVSKLKHEAKIQELLSVKTNNALPHVILTIQAELLEAESFLEDQKEAFELNRKEIAVLERLLAELYEIAEPTRLTHPDGTPYTDNDMLEANAAYEFTMTIAKEIQAEIIANGRPSPAKLGNAMSNPITFNALKEIGFIPPEAQRLGCAFDQNMNMRIVSKEEKLLCDTTQK